MSVLLTLIYRHNAIPIKISANYFMNINKLSPKFVWRGKRSRIANTILREKNLERQMLPDFKTYHRATIIKTVGSWWKDRKKDQWNWTENPEWDHINKVNWPLTEEQRQNSTAKIILSTNDAGYPHAKTKQNKTELKYGH